MPNCDTNADGRNPLPKHLAKAELSFSCSFGAVDVTAYIRLQKVSK